MISKKNIKSQAALEFLTTYGWAFLVILIMIGTLAYFGILTPSKLLPNRCTFGSEFGCSDHQLKAAEVRLKLKNNNGEPVDVTSFTLAKEDGTAISCTGAQTVMTGWKAGEAKDLVWTGCSATGMVAGNKGKVSLTIRYHASTSTATYDKDVSGEVYSTVI